MSNLAVGIAATQNMLPVGSMCLSDRLKVRMQSCNNSNMDRNPSQLAWFPQNINSDVTKSYLDSELAGYCKPVRYTRSK